MPHTKKPTKEELGIPSEEAVRRRLRAWLCFYAEKFSKTHIANSTGLSLAHVTNICNHEETAIGLDVFVALVFGMDLSARELLRENPPQTNVSGGDVVGQKTSHSKVKKA